MEVILALLTEKWILSAVLLGAYLMERRERMADKLVAHNQREEFGKRIDALSDVLLVIKEHIKH